MQIELTVAEHSLLITLLQERQRELLVEISRSEVHGFRRSLQEREAVLETLLRKLAPEASERAAA